MYIASAQPTAFFDVDSTLIDWHFPKEGSNETTVSIGSDLFVVNVHNLEYLKKLAMRKHNIIIWSAGGSEWAAAAAKALDIEHLVFACLNKPTYFVDDIADPREFMGKHVFYSSDGVRTGFKPNTLAHEEDK